MFEIKIMMEFNLNYPQRIRTNDIQSPVDFLPFGKMVNGKKIKW